MNNACAGALLLLALMLGLPCAAQTFVGTNTGAIPDGLSLDVPSYGAPRDVYFDVGPARTVTAVTVNFAASHTWVGDLRVTLIAPNGNSHLLFARSGARTGVPFGFQGNLTGGSTYAFSDSATANWWNGAGAVPDVPTGLYRTVVSGGEGINNPPAVTSMNAQFASNPANGRWILRFEDGASSETGSVTSANLILTLSGSTRTVNTTADSGSGSLRNALQNATSGDQIRFDPTFFATPRTINLQTPLPTISVPLAIQGTGAHLVTVRRADNAPDMRIFDIAGGLSGVSLGGMTISNGKLTGSARGGGILSQSTLTLSGVHLTGNRSRDGAGVALGFAGGQFINTTISGNRSTALAAAIYSFGGNGRPLRLLNCTVTGNRSDVAAGGIFFATGSDAISLEMLNSTVADNSAGNAEANGLYVRADGTGSATATMRNSLVANNGARSFQSGVSGGGSASIRSLGFNLSDNFDGQQVLASDVNVAAPFIRLGPLGLHGGSVPTRLPLAYSAALENGNNDGVATDARGLARPFDIAAVGTTQTGGNNADIGAVEMQGISVSNTNDSGSGSLRNAITLADFNGPELDDLLFFIPALDTTAQTINLSTELPLLTSMTISSPAADRLTIRRNASNQFRIFLVVPNAQVSLTGLTIKDGDLSATSEGGGIQNIGTLAITDSVVSDNRANGGGGIFNNGGLLFIQGSTIARNQANAAGGGLYNAEGYAQLVNTTVSGNLGGGASALFNFSVTNGRTAALNMVNTTIANNGLAGASPVVETFAQGAGTAAITSLRNTLLANNGGSSLGTGASGGGVATITSRGYNLTTDNAGSFLNQASDQNSANAGIVVLGNYGGPTPTHAFVLGSDAVDGGDNSGSSFLHDQRGVAFGRPVDLAISNLGDGSDVGAYEAQTTPRPDAIFGNGYE